MNKPYSRLLGFMLVSAGLCGVFLPGCSRELPFNEFLSAYEKREIQVFENEEYRLNFLYQNPDYLVAKDLQGGANSAEAMASRQRYEQGLYFSLTFYPRNASGTPEDIRKDFLNGRLAKGQVQFTERLAFLQEHIKEYVRLEDDKGHEILPAAYTFSRNFGLGLANSFLFVFPASFKNQKLEPGNVTVVVKDFGLQTGTISKRLKTPASLKLRI